MRLFSYVVREDSGFAPNPFWGYCTVACCKPAIRRVASIGDWVAGTGSVENVGNEKLIYAMKITDKLTFEEYSRDKRFEKKIPSFGLKEERGDNIYYLNSNKKWVQRQPSYHSKRDMKRDLSGKYVLISDYYFYFGRNAITIPKKLRVIIKEGPSHKSIFPEKVVREFIEWIETFQTGIHGDPYIFTQEINQR